MRLDPAGYAARACRQCADLRTAIVGRCEIATVRRTAHGPLFLTVIVTTLERIQRHAPPFGRLSRAWTLAALASFAPLAWAGGPFGIDHRVNYDDSGIWQRRNQLVLQDATVLVVVAGALWEGNDSRLGHTFWKSLDAVAIGAVTSEGMKYAFSRTRPAQTDNPNRWFQGKGNKSFPRGQGRRRVPILRGAGRRRRRVSMPH